MRRPFWRAQSQTWVFKLPGGKVQTLGKDPHGEGKKHPPQGDQGEVDRASPRGRAKMTGLRPGTCRWPRSSASTRTT